MIKRKKKSQEANRAHQSMEKVSLFYVSLTQVHWWKNSKKQTTTWKNSVQSKTILFQDDDDDTESKSEKEDGDEEESFMDKVKEKVGDGVDTIKEGLGLDSNWRRDFKS